MELPLIHETFQSWARTLTDQGVSARFAHGLDTPDESLVLSALLLTTRADPQRRANGPARREPRARPLARLQYLISIGASERDSRTEKALVSVMSWAEETRDLELLTEFPSPSWWRAWGIAPRPAFLLEATVTETSQPPATPVVKEHEINVKDSNPG